MTQVWEAGMDRKVESYRLTGSQSGSVPFFLPFSPLLVSFRFVSFRFKRGLVNDNRYITHARASASISGS